MNDKPIIGLAGGIGSGKSTVATLLAESHVAVISADELNHRELRTSAVREELKSWWGESICDSSGQLDRKRIAELVFADRYERRRLEQFLHPRIARERDRLIEHYQEDPSVRAIVLDTPLLFESGLDQRCDVVVFVEAEAAVRRHRAEDARGWTAQEWRIREKSQMALDNKRSRADHIVINNSSDLDQLRPAVRALLESVLTQHARGR